MTSLSTTLPAARPFQRRFSPRRAVEAAIGVVLVACAAIAVLTTFGIVLALSGEALRFFQAVPVGEFLFGTQWNPQIAMRADQVGSEGAFGAVPVFAGTFLVMLIAMTVAAPRVAVGGAGRWSPVPGRPAASAPEGGAAPGHARAGTRTRTV